MKRNLLVFVLFIGCTIVYGQQKMQPNYSNQFIKDCIIEVFQDQADALVFNNPKRYQVIKDFFSRVHYLNYSQRKNEFLKNKRVFQLSEIPLNNKMNSSMVRGVFSNINTFNPLKYQVNFASPDTSWYVINNSNFILVIESSQKINRK
jgi:hypothetical protein